MTNHKQDEREDYQPTVDDARRAAADIREARFEIERRLRNVPYALALDVIRQLERIEAAAYEVTHQDIVGNCIHCKETIFENDPYSWHDELICGPCCEELESAQ